MKVTSRELGFVKPKDGIYEAILTNIEWFPKEDNSHVLRCEFQIINSEYEGARISIFCNMDKIVGQSSFAKVLYFTGLSQKIAQKKGIKDLDQEEWPDEWFQISKELDDMINFSLIEISRTEPRVGIEIKTKGEYQNITQLFKYDELVKMIYKPKNNNTNTL